MKLQLPQIIYITHLVLCLAYSLKMDGKKYVIVYSFMGTVFTTLVMVWILYAGGFFTY